MNFSAANLVKQSATQILFLHLKNKTPSVTVGQIKGQAFADKLTNRDDFTEMRGTYEYKKNNIYFCFDNIEVQKDRCTLQEIKYVNKSKGLPQWYLESSILQVAFYESLLHGAKSKELITATFQQKITGLKNKLNLKKYSDSQIKSLLIFGDQKYEVKCTNKQKVLNHFNKKIDIIKTEDYGLCIEYDAEYKFNHFNKLKSYIHVTKIV